MADALIAFPVYGSGAGTVAAIKAVEITTGVYAIAVSGSSDVSVPVVPSDGGTGIVNNDASTITITGNFGITFTVAGATTLTLPASGTVATLTGAQAFTNKTYNGLTITASTGTLTIANGGTLSVGSGANLTALAAVTPIADGVIDTAATPLLTVSKGLITAAAAP